MFKKDEILPAIAVAVFDRNKNILLQKRSDMKVWGIPSGHVEYGETITNAAIREIFEETGLHIKIVRLISIYSDPKFQIVKYPNGRITHFVTCFFEGKITGGKLCNDSPETLDAKFFSIDNLPTNMLKMNPTWIKDALSKKGPYVR